MGYDDVDVEERFVSGKTSLRLRPEKKAYVL
jgi:hypothetical protein